MTAHGKKTGYTAQVEGELQGALEKYHLDHKIEGPMTAKQEREFAETFLKQIDNTDNKFIRGFNSVVKGGPDAVAKWYEATGKRLPLPILKETKAMLAAGEDIAKWKGMGTKLGRKIPFVKYAFVGATISLTFSSAKAEGASNITAGSEAAFEAANPLPLSLRDGAWIGEGLGNTIGDIYQIWNEQDKAVFGGRENIPSWIPGAEDVWR
jgi:hypothetical protein